MQGLGSIAESAARRERRAAERVVRLLAGETKTTRELGGCPPEEILQGLGMEIVEIFPRERTLVLARGSLRVIIEDFTSEGPYDRNEEFRITVNPPAERSNAE